jgi:hypothetical protein
MSKNKNKQEKIMYNKSSSSTTARQVQYAIVIGTTSAVPWNITIYNWD